MEQEEWGQGCRVLRQAARFYPIDLRQCHGNPLRGMGRGRCQDLPGELPTAHGGEPEGDCRRRDCGGWYRGAGWHIAQHRGQARRGLYPRVATGEWAAAYKRR